MSWIDTIVPELAEGRLRWLYDRVRGADGTVDNVIQVHGLRPHTLDGHLALYRAVLHHPDNRTPAWLLEAVGVYVSALNGCTYCVAHHARGMRRALVDEARAAVIEAALVADRPEDALAGASLAMMRYAKRLTRTPAEVHRSAVDTLREAGLDDGAILELNQVVAYFAYANRTVLGLGVTTRGEQVRAVSSSGSRGVPRAGS
ncbi:MAG: carboxymuconolactone decarboxylase family protein [Pseudomonadota bacterium]